MPDQPPMTPRQKIMAELKNGPMSSKDLSRAVHLPEKEVIAHLDHVARSVKRPDQFLIDPPVCNKCGFIFTDRRKYTIPSRCPKCRHEGIHPPFFRIE